MKNKLSFVIFIVVFLQLSAFGKVSKTTVDLFWKGFDQNAYQSFFVFDAVNSRVDLDMDIGIHCIVHKENGKWKSAFGEGFVQECKRMAVVQNLYPSKLTDYMKARFLTPVPDGWRHAISFAGINLSKFEKDLKKYADSSLQKHFDYMRAKNVSDFIVLINDVPYTGELMVLPVLWHIAENAESKIKVTIPKAEKKDEQKMDVYIIESDKFFGKENKNITSQIKKIFAGTTVTIKHIPYKKAKKMSRFKNLNIDFLPFYVLPATKKTESVLKSAIQRKIVLKQDKFLTIGYSAGDGIFVKEPVKKNHLTLFTMTQCPYGVMAANILMNAAAKKLIAENIDIDIKYIVDFQKDKTGKEKILSLHGSAEWEEAVRQLLIRKYYPSKFWKYLQIRNGDPSSSRWHIAAEKAAIAPDKIEDNFELGIKMLKEQAQYVNKLKIASSPTFLWQGRELISGIGNLKKIKEFEKLEIKDIPAGECG